MTLPQSHYVSGIYNITCELRKHRLIMCSKIIECKLASPNSILRLWATGYNLKAGRFIKGCSQGISYLEFSRRESKPSLNVHTTGEKTNFCCSS